MWDWELNQDPHTPLNDQPPYQSLIKMVMIICQLQAGTRTCQKLPRLSCSLNCLALESVSQVYFSVKFFFPPVLNLKRYKNKYFLGVTEHSCSLLYLFLIFCFCVGYSNMIQELSSLWFKIETGGRNRRNVKSHPNKNSHVSIR